MSKRKINVCFSKFSPFQRNKCSIYVFTRPKHNLTDSCESQRELRDSVKWCWTWCHPCRRLAVDQTTFEKRRALFQSAIFIKIDLFKDSKGSKKVSFNSNIRTLCGPQFCLAIVDLICQNISHRPFFSGSVVLVEEKGCNGAWVGITNWMTTPIWSHSLHRPLSDGGGGRPSVQYPLKNSIPPSLIWLNTLCAEGNCTKS